MKKGGTFGSIQMNVSSNRFRFRSACRIAKSAVVDWTEQSDEAVIFQQSTPFGRVYANLRHLAHGF
jgi:hypothetical protein